MTHFIRDGYIKISSDQLINPHPHQFTDDDVRNMRQSAIAVIREHIPNAPLKSLEDYDVRSHTKYMYSCLFLSDPNDPMDVYVTYFELEGKTIPLYIGKMKRDGLILPYRGRHWVYHTNDQFENYKDAFAEVP